MRCVNADIRISFKSFCNRVGKSPNNKHGKKPNLNSSFLFSESPLRELHRTRRKERKETGRGEDLSKPTHPESCRRGNLVRGQRRGKCSTLLEILKIKTAAIWSEPFTCLKDQRKGAGQLRFCRDIGFLVYCRVCFSISSHSAL